MTARSRTAVNSPLLRQAAVRVEDGERRQFQASVHAARVGGSGEDPGPALLSVLAAGDAEGDVVNDPVDVGICLVTSRVDGKIVGMAIADAVALIGAI
jgi:hypothetical protein